MAKPTIQKARKDYKCSLSGRTITAGELYWKIRFNFGPVKVRAYEHPFRRSETTMSDYLSAVYEIVDGSDNIAASYRGELETVIEVNVLQIQDLLYEAVSRFGNMPEGLQKGPVGKLLQKRIGKLKTAIRYLEDIDLDSEPKRNDFEHEYDIKDFGNNEEAYKNTIEEDFEEKYDEWVDDILDEIKDAIGEIDE